MLLLISLVTAGLIVVQAQYSASAQRAAAEGVLRDYSSLVADEVIRRSAVDIGYYGYSTLSAALVNEFQKTGRLVPSLPYDLLSAKDTRVKRAASLAKYYLQIDRPSDQIIFLGEAPAQDAAVRLKENLVRSAAQHNDAPFQVFTSQVGQSPRTFVTAFVHGTAFREVIVGFEADLSRLPEWFAVALRQPLVPASLGHGKVTNDFVQLRIRDQSGVVRYSLGSEPAGSFATTKAFGDTYQGVLSGFNVEASIDPQVARQIVIGGLPRSRLWLFLVLLGLNSALIVLAILQLRREMALQKLRDEFVSSVSHELRTPLTQIRMFAETLLLERVRSVEERQRSLEIIDREARRLTQLVENVLQFARMEKKLDTLAKENCEIAPLIEETVQDFTVMMNGNESRIETRLHPGLFADVDPGGLRQILINLLDNAVKYGKKSQQIIVGLEPHGAAACLYVEDEGPGIPLADRKRIFERFQRLDRDRQSSIAGTGIGLSIVRDLVVRHGGSCTVTSGACGGAKFIVELPLSESRPSPQAVA
ncbi:MAG: HAMP domain-containing sensor histidine kinase [Candidatus Acidiferrum sp.]